MLFIETRTSGVRVGPGARTAVLERLQERGLTPLIRSTRLGGFAQALDGEERAREFERAMAAWAEEMGEAAFVRGDIFFADEHAFFLVFSDTEEAEATLRAGLVYGPEETEPARRLSEFCRSVDEAVQLAASSGLGDAAKAEASAASTNFGWRAGEPRVPASFARFAAAQGQEADASRSGARGAETAERLRAFEALEDAEGRRLLRRLSEAQAEGRTSEMVFGAGGAGDPTHDQLVLSLAAAGLVRRELLISCRKDGRPLFRLPSADALAAITASSAVCSECGAAVADERAEELVTPTPLATSMLGDGAWLLDRARTLLSKLGVPESVIAARPATDDADAQVMADVCGEPFLFVLRDGDFTPAHARRALDAEADADAAHLVVVATGKIHEDARARLREHERRRARAGEEVEVILLEGVERAGDELSAAFERVSRKALDAELYELNESLGMNAAQLVAARFRLARSKPAALQDLAASAAGAVSGSPGE